MCIFNCGLELSLSFRASQAVGVMQENNSKFNHN